eukprot:SAG22_NODE_8084_length_684_cov_4.357265_1_plen_177_part_00
MGAGVLGGLCLPPAFPAPPQRQSLRIRSSLEVRTGGRGSALSAGNPGPAGSISSDHDQAKFRSGPPGNNVHIYNQLRFIAYLARARTRDVIIKEYSSFRTFSAEDLFAGPSPPLSHLGGLLALMCEKCGRLPRLFLWGTARLSVRRQEHGASLRSRGRRRKWAGARHPNSYNMTYI